MTQFTNFSEIMRAVKRRFWLMALIALVGCAVSVYYALQQQKEFQAIAVIQIEAPEVTESLAGAAARSNDAQQRVKLVEQRIMSRDNLLQIIQKHRLFADQVDATPIQRVGLLRGAIRLEQIMSAANSWTPGGSPSGLMIYVRLSDPDKARDVANDLMYGVIEASRRRDVEQARGAVELFAEEEDRVAGEIDMLEAQVADFKQQNSRFLAGGITILRDELGQLRQNNLDLDQQIVTIQSAPSRQRDDVATQQIALLEEQKGIIRARILEIEQVIATAPAIQRDLNQLERELTRKQDQYSVITRRKAEAEMGQLLQERQQGGRFEVLETALTPEFPVSRSRKEIALMGGVASGLLALLIGFAIELMNPVIRTTAQMERALGLQPVVSIPVVSTRGERIRRRIAWSAGLIGIVLAVPLAFRFLGDRITDVVPFLKNSTTQN